MKRRMFCNIMLVVMITLLAFGNAACENEYQQKLSKLTLVQLNALSADIDKEIDLNHKPDKQQEEKVLGSVKKKTEDEFSNRKWTNADWAWYDHEYSYTKDWDFYTLKTHVNYKDENNKGQKNDVYAEVLDTKGNYNVYYLKLGDTVLLDNRKNMGDKHWTSERHGIVNQDSGLDLSVYTVEELDTIKGKIQEEIKANHTPKADVSSLVLLLTKAETEQYCLNEGITISSWAWHDNEYIYSCDWNNYTLTTHINYMPKDSSTQKTDTVYSEAMKIDGRFYIMLIKMGDKTIYTGKHNTENPIAADEDPNNNQANTQNDQTEEQAVNVLSNLEEVSYLKGRGFADIAGLEPNYIGAVGFAAVYMDNELENIPDFSCTPWIVPVYQKNENGFEQTGTIKHKTRIAIVDQELTKKNGKEYQGYLAYHDLDTGDNGYIDAIHFVTSSYWEEKPVDAIEIGYGIAVYKQVSQYKPVLENGSSINLDDKMKVLLPAKGTYYVSFPDKINYQILGIVFIEKNKKIEKQYVFFNKDDLTLVY